MFGFLNVNKPPGVTSRDVVNHVQRLIRRVKAGHAGTLDPLATGVLVVAIGPATRLIEYVQQSPKQYRGEFLLGRESDTEDVEGTVRMLADPPQPPYEEIEAILPQFTGRILQRPPAYSALKVGGKRSYDLARAGKAVDLAPREIEIYSLRVVTYEYPRLTLDVTCGSGTYIRSLGRDMAEALGTAAVMAALVRTAVGAFTLSEAIALDEISRESIPRQLRPAREAVAHLPQVILNDSDTQQISRGLSLELPAPRAANEIAALDEQGWLRAILTRRGRGWGPSRNFPAP